MKIITFFNGKKTIIGSILMTLAIIITEVLVGIWGVEGEWIAPTVKTLNWIGMLLGGTGLLHKAMKGNTPIENKPQ
jgi:hypothetical protein